jgi:hypothetical protein
MVAGRRPARRGAASRTSAGVSRTARRGVGTDGTPASRLRSVPVEWDASSVMNSSLIHLQLAAATHAERSSRKPRR